MNVLLKDKKSARPGLISIIQTVWPFQLATILMLFCLRFFFVFGVYFKQIKSDRIQDVFIGFLNDLILVSGLFLFVFLIAFCLSFLRIKIVKTLSILVSLVLVLLTIVTNQYFLESNLKLDKLVLKFSLKELINLANVENTFSYVIVLQILAVILISTFIYFLFKKYKGTFSKRFSIVLMSSNFIFSLLFNWMFFSKPIDEKTELRTNTGVYFVKSCIFHKFRTDEINQVVNRSSFSNLDPLYISQSELGGEYPINHLWSSKSELSNYLKKTTNNEAPNIVIVIVESLSSQFVGKYADQTGKVMPFLDSLVKESLYFPNTFSTSQRTHNVLPAILASIPHNRDHSTFQEANYPDHESIISELKNDYYSRFYCGVDLDFDDMGRFIEHQRTDFVVRNWSKKILKNKAKWNNAWGVPDEELFNQSWIDVKEKNHFLKKKALLDVFLTMSTHEPYSYPNPKLHEGFVEKQISKMRSEKFKGIALENLKAYGAFNYTDYSLKNFFKKWSKHPKYKNTIFIITGDHGSSRCYFDPFKQYEVPLIIYSPLLKKSKQIDNVVSHFDIAPTLLNYLRLNYNYSLRNSNSFTGKELNFKKGFNTNRALVFKNEYMCIDDHFYKGYFYKENTLYKLNSNLSVKKVMNPHKLKKIESQVKWYKAFAYYCIEQNKLIPEIYRKKHKVNKENIISIKRKFREDEKNAEFISLFQQKSLKKQNSSLTFKIELTCLLKDFNEFQKRTVVNCKFGDLKLPSEELLYTNIKVVSIKNIRLKKGLNSIKFNLYIPDRVMKKVKNTDEFTLFLHNTENDHLPIVEYSVTSY